VLPILKAGGHVSGMSISVGSGNPETRQAEAATVEAIRQAERAQRETEREQRKTRAPGS
jgi:hypothetical protein